MTHLEKAFRQLREAWYHHELHSYAHEREWETESKEAEREADNAELKSLYDMQTEAIILGERFCVAPTCLDDMEEG